MAATARKPIKNEDLKKILPMKEGLNFAKQMENNIHLFERSSIEAASAITQSCNHIAAQWGAACTEGINSCVMSGEKSLSNMFGIGNGVMEGCHKAASDFMELSREAMDCRSVDELYNLQRKATALMMEHWVEEMRRVNFALTYGYGPFCILPPD